MRVSVCSVNIQPEQYHDYYSRKFFHGDIFFRFADRLALAKTKTTTI